LTWPGLGVRRLEQGCVGTWVGWVMVCGYVCCSMRRLRTAYQSNGQDLAVYPSIHPSVHRSSVIGHRSSVGRSSGRVVVVVVVVGSISSRHLVSASSRRKAKQDGEGTREREEENRRCAPLILQPWHSVHACQPPDGYHALVHAMALASASCQPHHQQHQHPSPAAARARG
jgi:hypothetical protein